MASARLAADPGLQAAYLAAHADYRPPRRCARAAGVQEPLPAGTQSAGGMPDRVKCLHALVAQELAVPGSNPLGAEAVRAAGPWWRLASACRKCRGQRGAPESDGNAGEAVG